MNTLPARISLAALVVLLLAILILGCSHPTPTATVVLVDPSGSVTQRARAEEFAAIGRLIPRMKRGDSLIVIPITNNAATEIEGRVLRLHAPERREAYDLDLRRFQDDARKRFAAFAEELLRCPGARTDILGTLDVAMQEIESLPAQSHRRLIVLSDFIEDDGVYRFTTAPELSNAIAARRLAFCVKSQRRFNLPNVQVYLGSLESNDFGKLPFARQVAIREFWPSYISDSADRSEIRMDGPGSIASEVR